MTNTGWLQSVSTDSLFHSQQETEAPLSAHFEAMWPSPGFLCRKREQTVFVSCWCCRVTQTTFIRWYTVPELSHCNFKTTLCCWYNSNISASCKCTLWKSHKLLILLVIIKRRQLTVSPLSPLIWGSSARSDSARAAVFARLSHRGRNPSDLGLGSCDSWTGLQTVQTGWNLKK